MRLLMKYDMLTPETARRYWDLFEKHSRCINEKYSTFSETHRDDRYSDRDRFVKRIVPKLVGKYFALADAEIIGYCYSWNDTNFYSAADPHSVYSPKVKDYWKKGDPIRRHIKKYYSIAGLSAVNEMYGPGYISLRCYDVFGNSVDIKLDEYNMSRMQFKEITAKEFGAVVSLFEDDRDSREYLVTRYLTDEEMAKRHLKRKRVVKEEVVVMARDAEEARNKLSNTLNAEAIFR